MKEKPGANAAGRMRVYVMAAGFFGFPAANEIGI